MDSDTFTRRAGKFDGDDREGATRRRDEAKMMRRGVTTMARARAQAVQAVQAVVGARARALGTFEGAEQEERRRMMPGKTHSTLHACACYLLPSISDTASAAMCT